MTRQILLDLFSRQLLIPLILNLVGSILSAVIILALGLRILKTDIPLRVYLPGALILGSFNMLLKPLFSVGFVTFLLPIVSWVLLLKLYSKSRLIICSWVTFVLLISTTIGPLLVISPLANSNKAVAALFFTNPYGMSLNPLLEALGPAIILVMFILFKLEIIPSPGQLLTRVDFYDIYLFLGLVYACYRFSLYLWTAAQVSSRLDLLWPLIDWLVSVSLVLVYYLKKVHDQKKNEKMIQEFEEEKARLQQRADELAADHEHEKSFEFQQLNQAVDEFFYNVKYKRKTIVQQMKSQGDPESVRLAEQITLEPREKDIIRLIHQGLSHKEIADKLDLTEGTVKNATSNLLKKVNLRSKEQLPAYGIKIGLIDIDKKD